MYVAILHDRKMKNCVTSQCGKSAKFNDTMFGSNIIDKIKETILSARNEKDVLLF